MTRGEQVASFLRQNKGKLYCDDCLASELRLANRQQANTHTGTLAQTSDFTKTKGTCSVCQEDKLVTCANG